MVTIRMIGRAAKCSLNSYFAEIEACAEAFLIENAEAFGTKTVTCSTYTRRAEVDPARKMECRK